MDKLINKMLWIISKEDLEKCYFHPRKLGSTHMEGYANFEKINRINLNGSSDRTYMEKAAELGYISLINIGKIMVQLCYQLKYPIFNKNFLKLIEKL